jgi:predicted nucleic-acid-binding Zn-ribbon protein
MPEELEYQPGALAWLESKLPNLRCPLCNHSEFTIGELLASPIVVDNKINLATPVPFVPLVCNNCGHALLFSAIRLGLVPAARE